MSICIVYELSFSNHRYDYYTSDDYPTLENSLLGAVKLTTNSDTDKYKYSGYGIVFDKRRTFSFPSDGFGCNVIIFGVNMSSYLNVDNKKKDILILGEGPIHGLDDTTLTTKKVFG